MHVVLVIMSNERVILVDTAVTTMHMLLPLLGARLDDGLELISGEIPENTPTCCIVNSGGMDGWVVVMVVMSLKEERGPSLASCSHRTGMEWPCYTRRVKLASFFVYVCLSLFLRDSTE